MLSPVKHTHIGRVLLAAIFWLGVSDNAIADATEADGEPPNSLSVFIGNTQNGSSNGASIGLEYERQLSPLHEEPITYTTNRRRSWVKCTC